MKRNAYIFILAIIAVRVLTASIVMLEKVADQDDGSGYKKNIISFNANLKYSTLQTVEIYAVDSFGTKTNLVKKSEFVGDHIIVKLKDGVSVDQLKKLNHQHHTHIRSKLLAKKTFLVGVNEVSLDSINDTIELYNMATNIIEYAEPDYLGYLQGTTPNDTHFIDGSLWGHEKIRCPSAWSISTGSDDIVVAFLDTGVDYNHPDLASSVWINPGESGVDSNGVNMATNGIDDDANGFIDDVHGWDFYNDNNDPIDEYGHGTQCAGIFGATGNNETGVVGVCWNGKIMGLKIFHERSVGFPVSFVSEAINGFAYVSLMKQKGINVRITSNSWVVFDYSHSLKYAVMENRDAGIICVAAVGNQQINIDDTPRYPASFNLDNIISVAGSDKDDYLYMSEPSRGSNYGVVDVDLAAPGHNILSTSLSSWYTYDSGTSFAAPFVSGAVALVWGLAPSLTYNQVLQVILDGVMPVESMHGKTVTGGRLDIYRALRRIPYGGMIYIR